MKTNTKLLFARIILKFLLFFGFKRKLIITRNGVNWSLDISEGIDLSLFLFGSFQKNLTNSIFNFIERKKDQFSYFNIIDVGSNIGDKSLLLTKILLDNDIQKFKIFSIEPTDYAFKKQIQNLKLNLNLKKKIFNYKYFISSNQKKPSKIFSSWNLDSDKKRHNKHGGILKKINNKTKIISLDEFIKKNNIKEKIIIKIDVDGFEIDVIKSLKKTLKNKSPIIFMEYAPYAFIEYGYSISDFFNFLDKYNYKIYDLNFNRLQKINIDDGSSIDVILIKDN